jgi:hypothetical protein
LDCPADQIELEDEVYVREARGCGKLGIYRYDFAKGAWSSLNQRAAFELSCDVKDLTVTALDSTTFGVSGCDAKAVYKYIRGTGFVVDTVGRTGEPPRTPKSEETSNDESQETSNQAPNEESPEASQQP